MWNVDCFLHEPSTGSTTNGRAIAMLRYTVFSMSRQLSACLSAPPSARNAHSYAVLIVAETVYWITDSRKAYIGIVDKY